MKDRFGIGWRAELAPGIFDNMDRLDIVEVIADDYFHATGKQIRALRTLGSQLPIVLHGIQLGLASCAAVDVARVDKIARLVEQLQPEFWSEHLAFVRGGGIEIGHLAAPPRTAATVEGAVRNIRTARAIVGAPPLVENVATLIEPPGSDCGEGAWVADILEASGADILLDLHNLYANALNFGYDPCAFIDQLPADRIAAVHLAGGAWIRGSREPRLIDDHLHDVPGAVYDLLTVVGRRSTRPLTVILERDGNYPSMEHLMRQVDRARHALEEGRETRHVACV